MRQNSSGKVLTIFLVIMAILLVSLTAMSIFIFQKEKEKRIGAEKEVEKKVDEIFRFKQEVREIKRKSFLLEEKNKEADEQINSVLDELELEKGLRKEVKIENSALKEKLEEMKGAKKVLEEKLAKNIEELEKKSLELKEVIAKSQELTGFQNINKELKVKNEELEQKLNVVLEEKAKWEEEKKGLREQMNSSVVEQSNQVNSIEEQHIVEKSVKKDVILEAKGDGSVELAPIVVVPSGSVVKAQKSLPSLPGASSLKGKILTVDRETEFVIINLGSDDGIIKDQIMSVLRDGEYLGDITVTRIQPGMSAADLISPLSSRLVKKNDQVVVK